MAQVEPFRKAIQKTGAELAYVAAEKHDGVFRPAKFLEKNPISFPFLLDQDRSVTRAYGLYHRLGLDAYNIAHPATLVIDQERIVRYLYRGENQSDRAPLEAAIKALGRVESSSRNLGPNS